MAVTLLGSGDPSTPGIAPSAPVPTAQRAAEWGSAIFNQATYAEVVGLLPAGRMPVHLRALRELFDDVVVGSSPGQVAAGAHKLASQAGMLGFEQLSACARQVENARGSAALERELGSLEVAMEAALSVLDQLLAEGSGSAVQAP